MTHVVDGQMIIENEPPQQCDMCGTIAELRPYGPNGSMICYECGQLDEPHTFARALAYWHTQGLKPNDTV